MNRRTTRLAWLLLGLFLCVVVGLHVVHVLFHNHDDGDSCPVCAFFASFQARVQHSGLELTAHQAVPEYVLPEYVPCVPCRVELLPSGPRAPPP